jgi:hypothetical protein
MTTNEIKIYVPSESMDFFYGNDINICVPADDVEHPVELIPNLDNIIFDFKKIITKPARKYVEITIIDLYKYAYPMYDEHTFDIMNEADAYRIIKDFIVNKEKSPELVFQVGFCENTYCVKWLEEDTCCKHRIASFKYEEDYTYIEGYSDTTYRIKIVL